MSSSNSIEEKIKQKAHELGFLSCGIAAADKLPDFEINLQNYIDEQRYADLDYMLRNQEKRIDPRNLVEGCQSVISVLLNYYNPQNQSDEEAPIISKYAYGNDYHELMKEKLQKLLLFIKDEMPSCEGRAFVDSAPVADKQWAQRAGLGWIGKNTLLITPQHGSFVFIGELLITCKLTPDNPFNENFCANCSKCINACPTGALMEAGKINVQKCISYHTTANKNTEISYQPKINFKNRVFGCDICQEACPWNKKPKQHFHSELMPNEEVLSLSAAQWANLTADEFQLLFRDKGMKQMKFAQLKRNINFLNDKI